MLSTDGFGTGEGQSIERPFGHADPAPLASWAGATASWPNRADAGGTRGLDDYFTRDFANNVGAEIMGRGKFGPQKGPWEDLEWRGWWGDEPPFHTPVFVLTHHLRPSITLSDTTFHFIDVEPHEALRQAQEAADGQDVRLGGGVSTVRAFLDADLVDTMHVAVAPVELAPEAGCGTRPTSCSTGSTSRWSRARAASSTTSSGAADAERSAPLTSRVDLLATVSQAGASSFVRPRRLSALSRPVEMTRSARSASVRDRATWRVPIISA